MENFPCRDLIPTKVNWGFCGDESSSSPHTLNKHSLRVCTLLKGKRKASVVDDRVESSPISRNGVTSELSYK